MIANNAMKPSTAPYHSRHIPIAQAIITAQKTTVSPAAGDLPCTLRPAKKAISWLSPISPEMTH